MFSIIIPIHNENDILESQIKKCISQLKSLHHHSYEIVLELFDSYNNLTPKGKLFVDAFEKATIQ